MINPIIFTAFLLGVIAPMLLDSLFTYNNLKSQDNIIFVDYQKNVINIARDDLNISLNRNRVYIDNKKITLDRCF